jgi:hypothetical protein
MTFLKAWIFSSIAVRTSDIVYYTGRFIMFSVTTNKKIKGPTLLKLFTATGKIEFFLQLQMLDVCTTGDTSHIDTIRRSHHGSLQQWRVSMHPCWRVCGKNLNIVSMCACHPWCTHRTSLVVKKSLFSVPVAVNNSIKVGPLVYKCLYLQITLWNAPYMSSAFPT